MPLMSESGSLVFLAANIVNPLVVYPCHHRRIPLDRPAEVRDAEASLHCHLATTHENLNVTETIKCYHNVKIRLRIVLT